MMLRSRILGVGTYHPPHCVTNDDLAKMIDTSDEWIQQRTGIKQRYWVENGADASDLGIEATHRALKAAGIQKEEIDLIIFATVSADHEFPGTGCFFQAKLELPGVPALDVRQQCTGFNFPRNLLAVYRHCDSSHAAILPDLIGFVFNFSIHFLIDIIFIFKSLRPSDCAVKFIH